MDTKTPSIELVIKTQDGVPYPDAISQAASFVIDEETYHEPYEKGKYKLVNTIEEFEDLLRQHEVEHYTKYTIIKTNGFFKGRGKDPASKPRIHWGILSKVSAKLATTPYLIVGTRYYVCHLGKCYYANRLRKFSLEENENKKRYKKVTDSKKVGCPANFKVQRLILFPDNKLSFDTRSERARMGEYIRENITSVKIDHKYIFKFPESYDHHNHKEQRLAAEKEPIDKKVVNKIKEIVSGGETNIDAIAELLEEFVETHIKVTDKNRRRFFPSKVDIQRNVYKAKVSLRKSRNDQDKLEALKTGLGESDEVYFQPSYENQNLNADGTTLGSRKCGLLFVYQNKEMRRLYNLYGHHCILLDPTYKFCKYSFPLYFIAVQTNVNYQIVGIFVTEFETKDAITEAFVVLNRWNPSVIPRYAMANNNIDEIKALESLFPEIKVLIPQYYCEFAWVQRLQRKDITVNREEALAKFRSIANAISEDSVQKSINDLKYWHSRMLKEYFERFWQKELKRWTICYRPSDLLFETNDAIDRLYDEFGYMSLSRKSNCTLSEIVLHLCQNFIPETLQKYKTLNISIMQRQIGVNFYIPCYLTRFPQWLLDFISKETMSADKSLPSSCVECLSEGHYSLLSRDTNEKFHINFSPEQKRISCTCFCFLKRRIICEHAIIVGRFYPSWNLEKICTWLFDNPIYKLDIFYSEFSNRSQDGNDYRIESNKNNQVLYKEKGSQTSNSTFQDSSKNSSLALRKECQQNLKYLGSLISTLDKSELKEFNESLKALCSTWSLRDKDLKLNSTYDDNIPFPMLKKIKDFYNNVDRKNGVTVRKRRRRKKKRLRMVRQKIEQIPVKYESDDLEMSSITIFYEGEFDNSLNSVCNLETKNIKGEPDEVRDLVMEITNPERMD